MRFSALFHPESAPVALDDTFHYVVLSALQWNPPNLDLMATASKQRFAVLFNQPLEGRFAIETLEEAHIQGAMSGVKLVSVHKDVLPIVLSDEVAGATFPAIEALWEPIKELDLNQRLEVDFSCEHEVYSGRSEYLFWSAVKEVLESNSLGIERYETPVLHDCTEEISSGDDPSSHQHHLDIRQPFSSEAVMPTGFCPHVLEHVDSIVGHSSSSMLECYVCPPQKWKMP